MKPGPSDDQSETPPEGSEGVRIIGPEEATEAVNRGEARPRRRPQEPRRGDRPPPLPSDGPRPAFRFPLDASAGLDQFERPSAVPIDAEPEAPELSHWAESAPEEVPNMSPRDPYDDDTGTWSPFAGPGPRWSDDDPETPEDIPRAPGQGQPSGRQRPQPTVFEDGEPAPGRSVFDEPPGHQEEADRSDDAYRDSAYDDQSHDTQTYDGRTYGEWEPYVDDDYDDSYEDSYSDDQHGGAGAAGMPPPVTNRPRPTRRRLSVTAGDRDMRVAVGVAAALGAAALVLFQIGPPATMVLVVAVLGLASLEYFTATQRAGFDPLMPVGLIATVGAVIAAYHYGEPALPLVLVLTVAVCLVWYLVGAGGERPMANVGVTLLGVCWVGLFGAFAGLLLAAPNGITLLVAAVIPTIGYDVGALFVGRSAGSRPLSPASPNKTIEGLAGGMVLAVVAGLLLGILGPAPLDGLADGLKIGLVVAVAAPLGDLAQSLLKRDLGVKDMGTLLPGHGGLLDRFDSILFVLPAIWYLSLVVDPQFFL